MYLETDVLTPIAHLHTGGTRYIMFPFMLITINVVFEARNPRNISIHWHDKPLNYILMYIFAYNKNVHRILNRRNAVIS